MAILTVGGFGLSGSSAENEKKKKSVIPFIHRGKTCFTSCCKKSKTKEEQTKIIKAIVTSALE